jgi:NADH-ubiquinone oxidoreductase chain 6
VVFLYFLCLITILFGIFVIISKNPIVSVLFLILLFSSVASYLILLDLTFIGLSYIIVYIGAVSILFLFILMLINVRTSELQSYTKNSLNLAIITGLVFNYLFSLFDDVTKYGNIYINTYNNIEEFIKNT